MRTAASAAQAVEQVKGRGVDGTIINGDIAWNAGLPQDYAAAERLLGALADHGPLISSPGNHDNRENLCNVFSDPCMDEGAAKVVTVVDAGAVRLVCLDSLRRTDIVSGRLERSQLSWLEDWLSSHNDKAVALFVHHPLDDPDNGLLDAPDLLDVVSQRTQVKAIFTAHDHVFSHRVEKGLLVVTQPAVGFPFQAGAVHGWLEAEFTASDLRVIVHPFGKVAADEIYLKWQR